MFACKVALSTTLAASLFAIACGGGGDEETDDTAREISSEELAQMVLAPDQFGAEYVRFTPDSENGVLSLDQATQEEDDPEAERADLQQFGYSSGYRSFYSDTEFQGTGVFYVGGVVYLFTGNDGADGYLSDSVDEFGEMSNDSDVSFSKFETFDLDVADEAIGARFEGAVKRDAGSESPLWGAVSYFRHGRITGALSIFGLQMDDPGKQRIEDNAKALASVMNERIATVLAAGAGTTAPAADGR